MVSSASRKTWKNRVGYWMLWGKRVVVWAKKVVICVCAFLCSVLMHSHWVRASSKDPEMGIRYHSVTIKYLIAMATRIRRSVNGGTTNKQRVVSEKSSIVVSDIGTTPLRLSILLQWLLESGAPWAGRPTSSGRCVRSSTIGVLIIERKPSSVCQYRYTMIPTNKKQNLESVRLLYLIHGWTFLFSMITAKKHTAMPGDGGQNTFDAKYRECDIRYIERKV